MLDPFVSILRANAHDILHDLDIEAVRFGLAVHIGNVSGESLAFLMQALDPFDKGEQLGCIDFAAVVSDLRHDDHSPHIVILTRSLFSEGAPRFFERSLRSFQISRINAISLTRNEELMLETLDSMLDFPGEEFVETCRNPIDIFEPPSF